MTLFQEERIPALRNVGLFFMYIPIAAANAEVLQLECAAAMRRYLMSLLVALEIALAILGKGGNAIIKIFEGEETRDLLSRIKKAFVSVKIVKPAGSQKGSREMYIVAECYCKTLHDRTFQHLSARFSRGLIMLLILNNALNKKPRFF